MEAGSLPFPGWYGGWDNPTWTFPDPKYPAIANPVTAGDASATTEVVPDRGNQGCVSWGAVIVSTTVQNSDNDGLLDVWKTKHGYCDASINEGVCSGVGDPAWVDLTGAVPGKQDVFVQLDYMCSIVTGTSVTSPGSCDTTNRLFVRSALDGRWDGCCPEGSYGIQQQPRQPPCHFHVTLYRKNLARTSPARHRRSAHSPISRAWLDGREVLYFLRISSSTPTPVTSA